MSVMSATGEMTERAPAPAPAPSAAAPAPKQYFKGVVKQVSPKHDSYGGREIFSKNCRGVLSKTWAIKCVAIF